MAFMKKRLFNSFLFCLSISWGIPLVAQVSAERAPEESWETALARNSALASDIQMSGRSASSSARFYTENFDVSSLPEWNQSWEELKKSFERLRDERPYYHSSRPQWARRATWLYPRDGCYARAAHSARSFEKNNQARPGKVFAFGNLKMKTAYDTRGSVYWSYHVAAAFRWNNEAYVMDPSVEPSQPLPLRDWLSRISAQPSRVKVAVCDSYAYVPGSLCLGGSSRQESGSENHLIGFLPREWNSLVALRMNPEKLVGDSPPWLHNSNSFKLLRIFPKKDWDSETLGDLP